MIIHKNELMMVNKHVENILTNHQRHAEVKRR